MKITIKSPAVHSNPRIKNAHVLEITPCALLHKTLTRDEIDAILNWLFRQFNRVDGSELISVFGLHMPSLSVGDSVEIEGNGEYLCEPVGWSKLR